MLNFDKLKQEELYKMNHYEVINYIADYVQYFYSLVMPNEQIAIPIPIEDILQKLDIKLKPTYTVEKDMRFYAITAQGYCSEKDRTFYYYEDIERKAY